MVILVNVEKCDCHKHLGTVEIAAIKVVILGMVYKYYDWVCHINGSLTIKAYVFFCFQLRKVWAVFLNKEQPGKA